MGSTPRIPKLLSPNQIPSMNYHAYDETSSVNWKEYDYFLFAGHELACFQQYCFQ